MNFAGDVALGLCDFGVAATLAGLQITGFFDAPGAAPVLGSAVILTDDPTFLVDVASISGVSITGAAIQILSGPGAGYWRVRRAIPEGDLMRRLYLEHV